MEIACWIYEEDNRFSSGLVSVVDDRADSIYLDIPEGTITPTDAREYALILLAAAEVAE